MDLIFYLLPQPRFLHTLGGTFALSADTVIALPPAADDDDLFAARQLQAEIEQATGLRLRLERQHRPYRQANLILLLRAARDAGLYAPAVFGWERQAEVLPDQAYTLNVGPANIVLAADSARGLYYGVQTLRQLVRLQGQSLPQVRIEDEPVLAERGVMLDVCRGKVPTLTTLKELVEQLSFFKINQFQMHNEHAYFFPRHPEIGANGDRLTNEEILELDAHCRRHHVELVPNLQSFGHMQNILSLPRYRHLAETDLCWSLAPVVPEVYPFLEELYTDFLPAFSSAQFNVNCDETWDLGQGRSAARCAEIGPGRLYLEHMRRVHALAAGFGRRLQMWADIVPQHPEVIGDLPADITLLDWHYEAQDSYPSTALLAQTGRRFLVCPGTSSWNTLFPRLDNANQNIRVLAREAATHGAAGLLNTDWGDCGHYQPLGQSWYGYAFGAEQAWTGGRTADAVFEPSFGRLFFGPERGEAVVAAMRLLAAVNSLPGVAIENASNTVYALFEEPLTGRMSEELSPDTLGKMVEAARTAEACFVGAADAGGSETLTLLEMAFSARLMAEAAEKVSLSRRIKAGWQAMGAEARDPSAACRDIDAWLRALEERWQSMGRLGAEFVEVWGRRAKPLGARQTSKLYRGVQARYDALAHWLRLQRLALERGKPLDQSMAAYGDVPYAILWERPLKLAEE